MDAARVIREADSKCEYGMITVGEYERIIAPFHDVEPVVRCKDCINRGNPKKCLVAYIGDVKSVPYFFVDNSGEFYCADGERK